jgi:hypothetical protein
MSATPEGELSGTMLFARFTDAVAVAMEQRSAQHCAFIVETFF